MKSRIQREWITLSTCKKYLHNVFIEYIYRWIRWLPSIIHTIYFLGTFSSNYLILISPDKLVNTYICVLTVLILIYSCIIEMLQVTSSVMWIIWRSTKISQVMKELWSYSSWNEHLICLDIWDPLIQNYWQDSQQWNFIF